VRAAQEVKASLEEFNAAQDDAVIKFPVADKPKNAVKDKDAPKKPKADPRDEQAQLNPKNKADQPEPKILAPREGQLFLVNRPMMIREDVPGSIRVVAGGNLTLMAVCQGDLTIDPGGTAVIMGIVSGNVINRGGDLHFTGIIEGQLIRQAGRTLVEPKSIIGGVTQ
jgi:hypothetical protein